MSIGLYMDAHVPGPVTKGLRRRQVDVLTAQDDGADRLADEALLSRATALGRTLFTQDDDFLAIAARLQKVGTPFGGVIYMRQQRLSPGETIDDLEIIAKSMDAVDCANNVFHLPL